MMWIVVVVLVVLLVFSFILNGYFAIKYVKMPVVEWLPKEPTPDAVSFYMTDLKKLMKHEKGEVEILEADRLAVPYTIEDVTMKGHFTKKNYGGRSKHLLHYEMTYVAETDPLVMKFRHFFLVPGYGVHKPSRTIVSSNTIALRQAKALYPLLGRFIRENDPEYSITPVYVVDANSPNIVFEKVVS